MTALLRFAASGAIATATHAILFAASVELLGIMPVIATSLSFCVALIVSYGLNYHWTFKSSGAHRVMLPRYATVALVGLALNVVITFVVVNMGGYWYGYALLAVISTVPVVSFLLSKYWAFGTSRQADTQGE